MTDRRKLRSDDGDNNVVLHHFPILPSPTPSMCCLFSFFRTRAADQHTSKYVCTIFPTSSPPIGGRETRFTLEKKRIRLYTFIHVSQRNSSISRLSARMEFEYFHSLFYYKRGGRGADECWKHRVSSYRGICNLMEFAGNINKPSKRFPNWKNKREFVWTI